MWEMEKFNPVLLLKNSGTVIYGSNFLSGVTIVVSIVINSII